MSIEDLIGKLLNPDPEPEPKPDNIQSSDSDFPIPNKLDEDFDPESKRNK